MRQPEPSIAHVQPTVSHIVQQEARLSMEAARQRNSHMQEGKNYMQEGKNTLKASTLICSQDFRKSAFAEHQILEVESAKSSVKMPISNKQPPPQVQYEPKRASKTEKNRKGR